MSIVKLTASALTMVTLFIVLPFYLAGLLLLVVLGLWAWQLER